MFVQAKAKKKAPGDGKESKHGRTITLHRSTGEGLHNCYPPPPSSGEGPLGRTEEGLLGQDPSTRVLLVPCSVT